ncbi:MAG: hypothetical protein A3I29_01500 [Candidatus Magasanikbacteria bacterium RIFCSPLOWO2_02_FULL_44_11]|uniref:Uncharacterized protein n=2 Tax=Candidatus Magasanikiibacteriota TaxID=1752731 RepID=A0A1F6NA15_9BACT|nr:MAG: hypothetical protein A3D53_00070 [Candidatus Magasanikbacteria bacterium RIFCSPHIGHO2_02_FULL_45_10]OGH80757.1 MAG: hypothetical protein A3I29_01500 [Candidatus Magasanikbacteria bacterium RIFCSPLOWO2_02_FULL_44_11]
MSFKHLFYGTYWFNQPDPARGRIVGVYLAVLLGCILAALVVLMFRRYQSSKAIRLVMVRYAALGLTTGIIGLLLFVFRQQRVFFLGWRVWYGLLLIVAAVWLSRLLLYTFRRIPAIKAEQAERARLEKYLPKK